LRLGFSVVLIASDSDEMYACGSEEMIGVMAAFSYKASKIEMSLS
jgi:hypothetical protein